MQMETHEISRLILDKLVGSARAIVFTVVKISTQAMPPHRQGNIQIDLVYNYYASFSG